MKQSKLEKIIGTAAIIGLIVSFIMLVGTAGAIECDTITAADGIKRGAIWLGIMIASVICIVRLEGDDDEYRRL